MSGFSGKRVSAEAIERDRVASRERARLRRARMSEEDHELELKHRRIYEATKYGNEKIDKLASRRFIGWDGEGYSLWIGNVDAPPERKHFYMLFGCSARIDSPLLGRDLGTLECFEYALSVERSNPDAFHVGFAFDYDVNMILKDLPRRKLKLLAEFGFCHWMNYRIAYIPGKRFTVTKTERDSMGGKVYTSITIEDVFGFFHSKYTTSLLKFDVASEAELEAIMKGKEERPNFTYNDREFVLRYWQDEISYMPGLMERVRDAAYDAGYYIRSWHGPGALAAYVIRKRGVNAWHSKDVPQEARIATQYAMAGGRFQFWKFGLYHHDIYTADINSAYIYASSLLPNLATGRWRRVRGDDIDRSEIAHFGLYHVRYHARRDKADKHDPRRFDEQVHPLFNRDKRGNLRWPRRTDGWYWSPEARTVADNPDAEFLEAWIYDDDGSRPFGWVHDEFDKRLQLQKLDNPAEKTIKWMLAAIYGAFARRVGWDRKTRKPPRSHELMWAGFITSWCRAEVFKVANECQKRGGLISIDTDGVTSTVPIDPAWLETGVGDNLGQWKLVPYTGVLYAQNGFYWQRDADGEWSNAKTRGIKRGSVPFEEGLKAWETDWTIARPLTKFTGFREALKLKDGMSKWRTWDTVEHKVRFGGNPVSDTSYHLKCLKCRNPELDAMHTVWHWPSSSPESQPYKLPWLDDDVSELERNLILHVEDETDNL